MPVNLFTSKRAVSALLWFSTTMAASCLAAEAGNSAFAQARGNGMLANEAYVRSLRLTKAWLEARDPVSGLIPSRLRGEIKTDRTDVWEPHNAGADNYSFMTLTAWLLDRPLFENEMTSILRVERKLTSRFHSLPDNYSFSKRGFQHDEPDNSRILFAAAEYIKDGLLPLAEYMGRSPWTERMLGMLDDIPRISRVSRGSQMEQYRAVDAEINGNMLQTLSRNYWMTGDQRYLDWATEIGDHYLLGGEDLRKAGYIRLRDHGCEIIAGLSELYVTLHFSNRAKKELYKPALHGLLDDILAVGRNRHGLFYDAINLRDRSVVETRIADTWGYIFDAYYAVHLVDTKAPYVEAITKALGSLNPHYRNHDWENGSHDGYADSIESALNMINRIPSPDAEKWIDSEIKVMWAMQRDNGIVEGWWGDGNFSRTNIMYGLWKTQGAHAIPWREDLMIGATRENEVLRLVMKSDSAWEGRLLLDRPRHRDFLKLPIDYTRINQFPEWFTAETDKTYTVSFSGTGEPKAYSGRQLISGIPIKLTAGRELLITVTPR